MCASRFGIILGGILGYLTSVLAESRVVLPDTTLWQGQQAALPVWVQFQVIESSLPLTLVLLYSANRLRVLQVFPDSLSGFCQTIRFRDTLLSSDTGQLEIACIPSGGGGYSGIFAWIGLEVLAGRDTLAWIEPVELRSNGTPLPVSRQGARIRILGGPPVEPIGAEGLWAGAPNPFGGELVLRYSVARPGQVFFRLFSLSGREIPLEPSSVEAPRMGTYTLRFRFLPWEVSSGGYIVQMVTEFGGVYLLPVMCVK